MQGGWYCRATQEQQSESIVDVDDESSDDSKEVHTAKVSPEEQPTQDNVDYKAQYRYLKRKLKFLIYENEFFQEALRSNQRRLLKVSRDRSFLLDRLLQYEKPEEASESDLTESSDEEPNEAKKKKLDNKASLPANANVGNLPGATRGRKRKVPQNSAERNRDPTVPKFETVAGLESLERATPQNIHSQNSNLQTHLVQNLPSENFTQLTTTEPLQVTQQVDHAIDSDRNTNVTECVTVEYTTN